jgi:hypothetical protein
VGTVLSGCYYRREHADAAIDGAQVRLALPEFWGHAGWGSLGEHSMPPSVPLQAAASDESPLLSPWLAA